MTDLHARLTEAFTADMVRRHGSTMNSYDMPALARVALDVLAEQGDLRAAVERLADEIEDSRVQRPGMQRRRRWADRLRSLTEHPAEAPAHTVTADREGPDEGHTFRLVFDIRPSSAVVGEPMSDGPVFMGPAHSIEVRAWNLRDALRKASGLPFAVQMGSEWSDEALDAEAPAQDVADVRVEWAVDLYADGGLIAQVPDEAAARRWVQSYVDHPEALDEGERLPVAVTRTVTTTAWVRADREAGDPS